MAQIGRAWYLKSEYREAIRHFEKMQRFCPYMIECIDIWSTSIWHLQDEVKLACLAHHYVALAPVASETQIVVGNCFSLQKDHETSLKFFLRAIKQDPHQPYAYTLRAHEYFSNEDFDKAIQTCRKALQIDKRHYTAFFLLGRIYYHQEKF